MKGVALHAVLLALVLLGSVFTWARELPSSDLRQLTLVWSRDTTSVTAIELRSDTLDVDLTRRSFPSGSFLWGSETLREEGSAPATREFPAGGPAQDILEALAEFRVVRDLGLVADDARTRYGLDDPEASIAVVFGDERRVLALGRETAGGSHRYARDEESGRTYVVPGEVVRPLEGGEGALRERRIHYFADDEVASVRVESLGRVRTMRRVSEPGAAPTWADAEDPARPDQGFANFMERVGQLATDGFPDPESIGPTEPRLRIDYLDEDGGVLGFVELLRSTGGGPVEYYLLSERLPVRASAIAALAERVDLDLPQIF